VPGPTEAGPLPRPSLARPVAAAHPVEAPPNAQPFRMFHDLAVRLDPQQNTLYGDDRIGISRVPDNGQVAFHLHPDLRVRAVWCESQLVPAERDGSLVRVDLGGLGGQPTRLRVRYDGPIPTASGQPPTQGVYLYDDVFWHPNHLGEHGESRLEATMPDQWAATASAHEEAVTTDKSSRVYVWDTPWAGTGFSLAAAQYKCQHEARGAQQFRTFLCPDSAADAKKLIDESASVMRFFEPLFGPFPYDHLDIVESRTAAATGGAPAVVLFDSSAVSDARHLDAFMAHQIAHGWWAGAIGGYGSNDLWYESFSQFSADLYTQGAPDSTAAAASRNAILADWRAQVGEAGACPVAECTDADEAAVRQIVAYRKGAFVLHMLRDRLGDEVFFNGMRRFVADNEGSLATWADAEDAFERASGHDLSGFFEQWLERGDAPSLALRDVTVEPVANGYKVSGKLHQVQSGAPYSLQVPLTIQTAGGPCQVETGQAAQGFECVVPDAVKQVTIDPQARLFRLTTDEESWVAPSPPQPPPATLLMS
jgi:hypothetical protein